MAVRFAAVAESGDRGSTVCTAGFDAPFFFFAVNARIPAAQLAAADSDFGAGFALAFALLRFFFDFFGFRGWNGSIPTAPIFSLLTIRAISIFQC